jgi:nitrite reductase (NADH) small subunit
MTLSALPHQTARTVRVCRLHDLSPGIGRSFNIAGRAITLFRTREDKLRAIDSICPHAGAPLADGILASGCVVCPYHAHRFDLTTGQCESASLEAVDTYPVRIESTWVVVSLPD